MAPDAKRAVALVAAGAFSVAGVAFAVSHEYTRRLRRSGAHDDPELSVPDGVGHRVLAMRDGGESHLIELGEGPPVVLLHGANLSAEVWSYQLRDLSEKHRVLALDLRGHGLSRAGSEDVTIPAMAEDVAQVLEELDLDRAVLVGHSMGGMVSLRLFRCHPELLGTRIGAVALVATSAGVGLPSPSWARLASAVSLVAGAGVGIWRPGRSFATADAGYLASRVGFGRKARPAEVAATMRMLRAVDPQVFAKLVSEVLGFNESAPYGDIGVALAVAVGSSDHLTPPLYARRLAAGFERAELSEYAGAGHMLMYERREEIDELLTALSARAVATAPQGSSRTLTAPVDLASARASTPSRQRAKG
ncbi:MAG: alpha/beta fold hydrolase [Acidimicrobiales bacterium]|jgi:pimeloyl-ACP methyl ester carboxylesterase